MRSLARVVGLVGLSENGVVAALFGEVEGAERRIAAAPQEAEGRVAVRGGGVAAAPGAGVEAGAAVQVFGAAGHTV